MLLDNEYLIPRVDGELQLLVVSCIEGSKGIKPSAHEDVGIKALPRIVLS
jgi:hypothetical protein